MKKMLSLVMLSAMSAGNLLAQEGAMLLSHFQESTEIEDQSWSICQDNYGTMLFANRRGIMTFDGVEWDFVKMPSVPYSVTFCRKNNRIYAGGENNYGYLEKDDKGFYRYFSLSGDSVSAGLITKIIATDSTIWFYSETTISRHNLESGQLEKRFETEGDDHFTGMMLTPVNIFINVSSEGLYRLDADTLFPIVTGYLLKDEEVLFSLPYSDKMVLIGTGNSKLSLFDGIKFYDYKIRDEGYLADNILTDGIAVSDSLYAFSTVNGGCLVVRKEQGSIFSTINYQNGLPDDEVYAIAADDHTGLWISHQYGLSRAALNLPAGNFSIYPGLTGNVSSTILHNEELFVATSEGVFYLDEVKNYGEVEILVRSERSSSTDARPLKSVQAQDESGRSKKGLLSRIFGKKESVQISEKDADKAQPETTQKRPEYVRKKVSRLKSVNYVYKKVPGINEKCRQLVSTPAGILLSTNSGLFVIADHKALAVRENVYVNHISHKSGNSYYVATNEGYFVASFSSGKWNVTYHDRGFSEPVYSVTSAGPGVLWAGGTSTAYRIVTEDNKPPVYKSYSVLNDYPNKYLLDRINDTVFLFTEGRIFYYNAQEDMFSVYLKSSTTGNRKIDFILAQPGIAWYYDGENWKYMPSDGKVDNHDAAILKIFDKVQSISLSDSYLWIVAGNTHVYRIELNRNLSVKKDVDLFVKGISNEDGLHFDISDAVLKRGDNTVIINLVSPGFLRQNSNQYQYLLEDVMSEWSGWTSSPVITLMPPPGNHKLLVRARDIWGNVSEAQMLRFTIKAPFTKTTGFYLLILAIILSAVMFITRLREQTLVKEKMILEEKVRERTREIQAQKEEITSSIEYASRIQMAMLPMDDLFAKNFADHFIFFMPRDIVSGDFYWIDEDDRNLYFTVADCTGHGVPGAFMSTLGISSLHEIVNNNNDLSAAAILNILRQKIKTSLHQTGKEGEAADGMDIAMCKLDREKMKLEYAGAYNPLIMFQNGELKEFKADRMPIGIHYVEKETFTNHETKVRKGDVLYIFSDGFCDQFGGPDGVKFKMANLKKLLTEIHSKPLQEQKEIIKNEFYKWKGSFAQVDDVSIIGIRI